MQKFILNLVTLKTLCSLFLIALKRWNRLELKCFERNFYLRKFTLKWTTILILSTYWMRSNNLFSNLAQLKWELNSILHKLTQWLEFKRHSMNNEWKKKLWNPSLLNWKHASNFQSKSGILIKWDIHTF